MNNNIFNFFALFGVMGESYGDSMEDIVYCLNEKVEELRWALTFEVIDLYEDKGYSYEKVNDMIDNLNLEKEDLTNEEVEYLKRTTKNVLDIRFSLREKSKIKIK